MNTITTKSTKRYWPWSRKQHRSETNYTWAWCNTNFWRDSPQAKI